MDENLIKYDSVENQLLRSNLSNANVALEDFEFNKPIDINLQPRASAYLQQIRALSEAGMLKQPNTFGSSFGQSKLSRSLEAQTDNRPGFSEWVVPIDEVYERLNDGTYYPKYENILAGSNNEERLARTQGTAEVWGRGLKRFGTQIGTSFVGNLISIPVGIGEWINTGNFEATYDNDFTRMLDDLDRKGQLNNNIYYSQADKDRSLWGGAVTSRFWADKVLGGASFTVGMLLSEGLMAYATGGGSLATGAGRIGGKIALKLGLKETGNVLAKGLSKGNSIISNVAKTEKVGATLFQQSAKGRLIGEKAASLLNDARFMITSTGYESGMEARHFRKQAEDDFYGYYNAMGITPTSEEVNTFENDLNNNSNKVLLSNMGILSVSNTALFGRMFGIGNTFKGITNSVTKPINKQIFGIGTKEIAPGVFKELNRKTYQKVLSVGWNGFTKPSLSEGVWEEGGQGVASNMMSEYMRATYDPNISKEISGYTDAFYKSMEKQYSTKEGQEEVLVGAIIGTLFGALSGGSFTRHSREAKAQAGVAENETISAQAPQQIVQNLYTQENLLSQIGGANRIVKLQQSAEEAEKQGEIVDATLKSEAMVVSALQAAHSVGKDGSFIEVMKGTIQGMDNQKIMDSFGLESIEEVNEFKADKINTLSEINKNYSKNLQIAESFIGRGRLPKELRGKEQFLIDSLSFSLTMSQSSERVGINAIKTIKDVFNSVGNTSSASVTDILGMFAMAPDKLKEEYDNAEDKVKNIQQQIEDVTKQLKKEQTKPVAEKNTEKALKLEEDLLSLQNNLSVANSILNGIRETIENNYFNKLGETGLGSNESLASLEEAMKQSKNAVDSLENSSPEAYIKLTKAFDSLDKAVNYSREFSKIYEGLLDPKFNTKIVKTLFGKQISSVRTLNDLTRDTIGRITKSGVELRTEGNIEVSYDNVSFDEYNTFLQNGTVSEETLSKIKNKIDNNLTLTKEESEIYEAKKDTINISSNIEEVVKKLQNKEPLTEEEKTNYDNNKEEIDSKLNDPLNNTEGTSIAPDTVPPLSEEVQEKVKENEKQREEFLNSGLFTEEEVNEEYNTFYKDQVAQGKMTKNQALNELGKIGQQSSTAYSQILNSDLKGKQTKQRALREQLKEIVSSHKLINKYFKKQELSDLSTNPLSEEDLKKYKELTNKKNKSKLTAKELSEMEEIEQSLYEYNVLQGTIFDGNSLIDLIRLYNQLNISIKNEETDKLSHTEQEYVSIAITEERTKEGKEAERNGAISQITEYAFAKYVKGGVYISHIQLSDLIEKILKLHEGAVVKINGEIVEKEFEKYNAKGGSKIEIQLPNDVVYTFSIKGKKNKRSGEPIFLSSKTPSKDLSTLLNFSSPSVSGQKGEYYVLYETIDNQTTPIKSSDEFHIKNESGLEYDSIEARNVKNGDTVELFFDMTDSYNKTLSEKDWVKEGNIYILKNGKIVGRLKANRENDQSDSLYETRKKVVLEGRSSVVVSSVLMGLPILQTTSENTKKLVPVNKNEIITQGYYLDGESSNEIPEHTSTRFIETASKNNPSKKVPYVVIQDKVSGNKVAFPVELSSEPNTNILEQFDSILTDTSLSPLEKSIALNNILIENNVDFDSYWFSAENVEDSFYTNSTREMLETQVEPIDLDKFSNEIYYDVSAVVNFENESFTPPKLLLNFETVTLLEKERKTSSSKRKPKTPAVKPKDILSSSMSYRINKTAYKINFKDNVDKMLFLISFPSKPSDYTEIVKTLESELNLSEKEILNVANSLRGVVRNKLEGSAIQNHNLPMIYKALIKDSKMPPSSPVSNKEEASIINVGRKVSFWLPGGTQTGIIREDGRIVKDGDGTSVDASLVKELKILDIDVNETLNKKANKKKKDCK